MESLPEAASQTSVMRQVKGQQGTRVCSEPHNKDVFKRQERCGSPVRGSDSRLALQDHRGWGELRRHMLNPARGRAERGNREDKAPAPEREAPTPTRGLVNRGRQIRDREQSCLLNPVHSKRGQEWRGGKDSTRKPRDPRAQVKARDGSIVPRTSCSRRSIRQVGGRSSVGPEKDPAQRRNRRVMDRNV